MNTGSFLKAKWALPLILALALCLPDQLGVTQPALDGTTINVNAFDDNFTLNGNCTLREAVQAANTDMAVDDCPAGNGPDTILMPAGMLKITTADLYESPEDDANATGDFDITSDVTIIGAGKLETILDGDGDFRAFDVHPGAQLALREFTLSRAYFHSHWSGENGGLQNRGTLVIDHVRVDSCGTDNINETAPAPAGAISNFGPLTIRHSEFIENLTEYDGEGGAITSIYGPLLIEDSLFMSNHAYFGAIVAIGQITIRRSVFRSNISSSDSDALGFYGGTVLVEDSRFEDNSSDQSWRTPGITFRGDVTIRNTEFVNNSAVQVHDNTLLENVLLDDTVLDARPRTLTVRNSTIRRAGNEELSSHEEDDYLVGALRVNHGVVRLENSTLTANNSAVEVAGGELTILNSTLSGNDLEINSWDDTGWDSLIMVTGGSLTIESSTVTNNHGDYALHVKSGGASLLNTILNATHWPGEPNHMDCKVDPGASLTSRGYNLIHIATGCGWTPAIGDQLGTGLNPFNPGLYGLADNGGPTLTHALRDTSIALDTGHPSLFPPTDQRGEPRPADGDGDGVARVDIGAFEAAAPPPKLDLFLFLPQLER